MLNKPQEKLQMIFNPSAGISQKDRAISIIFKELRPHFRQISITNSLSPADGTEIAKQSIPYFDIITAFGGDGTINSIATALLGSGKTLGILPGGSGNGLVRNLNIPISWKKALQTLISGKDTDIDAAKINNIPFFNIAGIGLDASISKKFNTQALTRGIPTYVYYTLKESLKMPTIKVQITIEDHTFNDEILLTAFANFKQYGGKLIIAPFANPNDHLLDLCIINKFQLLKESLKIKKLFNGNIHEFPFYKTQRFKKCEIQSLSGPIPFHFDGEYGGQELTHFEIDTLPNQLRIRVPQSFGS